jgi:hypothetical protein
MISRRLLRQCRLPIPSQYPPWCSGVLPPDGAGDIMSECGSSGKPFGRTMKIAELEAHHDAYTESERTIRAMVANHDFPAVFSFCVDSFPHIVPAINYRKKREIAPIIPDVLAFDTICRYAPPLFEHPAIDSLSDFLRSARILSQSEKNFPNSVDVARKRGEVAHTLWNHLEQRPGMLQRNIQTELGILQEDAVAVVELWDDLGILDRQMDGRSYRLRLRTRLDAEVAGLCPSCGVRGRGRKELFFRSISCRKCGVKGHYHIEYGGSL